MINLNQEVTIKWFTRNKQRYISLGYEFTQLFEYFRVKVKDLEKNSNVKVEISCDACGAKIVTWKQMKKPATFAVKLQSKTFLLRFIGAAIVELRLSKLLNKQTKGFVRCANPKQNI